jgi:hypothetical protein
LEGFRDLKKLLDNIRNVFSGPLIQGILQKTDILMEGGSSLMFKFIKSQTKGSSLNANAPLTHSNEHNSVIMLSE